jgi:hypothetical protein
VNKMGVSIDAPAALSLLFIDGGDDRLLAQQSDSTMLLTACSQTSDCPVDEYCDYGHSCYHCSYLTEKCDTLGGDCCSSTFLHNCPSNPLKALCHPCKEALEKACNTTRTKAFDCARCSGIHQHDLQVAGCTNDQIARWCSGQPVNPPPCHCIQREGVFRDKGQKFCIFENGTSCTSCNTTSCCALGFKGQNCDVRKSSTCCNVYCPAQVARMLGGPSRPLLATKSQKI